MTRRGRSIRRFSSRRKARPRPSGRSRRCFREHGLPMSLYTDRGRALFSHAEGGGEIDRGSSDPGRPGARATGRRAYRGLFAAGAGPFGAGVPDASGSVGQRAHARRRSPTIEAANAFIRDVYLPDHNARFAVEPAGEGSAFTPIPGVDLDEILCVRRSGRSATTIASPTAR